MDYIRIRSRVISLSNCIIFLTDYIKVTFTTKITSFNVNTKYLRALTRFINYNTYEMRLWAAWYSLFLDLLALNPSYPDSYISLISRAPPSFPSCFVISSYLASNFFPLFSPASSISLLLLILLYTLSLSLIVAVSRLHRTLSTFETIVLFTHHCSISLFITSAVYIPTAYIFARSISHAHSSAYYVYKCFLNDNE